MITQELLVSGRVQGVGFRYSASKLAQHLGVTGTVQNLPNGQVAIVASADADVLADFAQQLRTNLSPWIQVSQLKITDRAPQHFTAFRIII